MNARGLAEKGLICVVAAILALSAHTRASFAAPLPAESLESMSLEDLMNIPVYAASRYEQKSSEAPASVSIVTSEQIRRYGWRTLVDVLRSVRGFHASSDRNYDSVGVRGFTQAGDYNSRVLLLVDGHRANDMIYGQNSYGHDFPVDVDLIDRVEIVRGPTSALYGSNAFFAVVNVITRRGQALKGVEISGEAARYDTYKGRVTFGSRLPGGQEYLLSATRYKSGGQDLFFPEFADPATNNGIASGMDGERQAGIFGSASLGDFDVRGVYSQRVKVVPTASYGTIFNDPRYKTWDDRAWVDLSWRKAFGDRTEATARVYYDWYHYHGDYPFAGVDNTVVPPLDFTYVNKDGSRNQWYGAELLLSHRFGDSHRVTGGGGVPERLPDGPVEPRRESVFPVSGRPAHRADLRPVPAGRDRPGGRGHRERGPSVRQIRHLRRDNEPPPGRPLDPPVRDDAQAPIRQRLPGPQCL